MSFPDEEVLLSGFNTEEQMVFTINTLHKFLEETKDLDPGVRRAISWCTSLVYIDLRSARRRANYGCDKSYSAVDMSDVGGPTLQAMYDQEEKARIHFGGEPAPITEARGFKIGDLVDWYSTRKGRLRAKVRNFSSTGASAYLDLMPGQGLTCLEARAPLSSLEKLAA